ncbi:acyl-CoA thioesterase [Dysgonomonas sp. 216]|uniref:acyl-CoA thioesterase n=1 Tax=Dysgonomonas sp. 216 TaxID=2302934 RepID=UPI0013D7CC59|nr:acyl-CoA thioesterase [Dysgonomonas sp. 216]NDW19497.1 acyl-CoA thioesterase [Dysgonomonas sp. 216]
MDKPIFQYKMKVRDYECDAQGIVNNANYQHYYEVARHEFLDSLGLNFFKLHQQGIDAVVSQVTIKYKNSLYGGEEFICTVDFEKKGVRYLFKQQIIRTSDEKLCSEAVIEVVTLINGKLSRPDFFDKAFAKYL